MAWTAITDRDICVEGKENKINCYASGTIYAGQGVTLTNVSQSSQTYVMPGNAGADKLALGIAATDGTSGKMVAVYTAGAVCWTRANAAVTQGDWLFVCADGDFDDCTDGAAYEIAMSGAAIALASAGANQPLKVLLK